MEIFRLKISGISHTSMRTCTAGWPRLSRHGSAGCHATATSGLPGRALDLAVLYGSASLRSAARTSLPAVPSLTVTSAECDRQSRRESALSSRPVPMITGASPVSRLPHAEISSIR